MAWIGYTLASTPPMGDLGVDFEGFDVDGEPGEDDSTSGEKAGSSTEENMDSEA